MCHMFTGSKIVMISREQSLNDFMDNRIGPSTITEFSIYAWL